MKFLYNVKISQYPENFVTKTVNLQEAKAINSSDEKEKTHTE